MTDAGRSVTPGADAILLSRYGRVAYALTDACTVLERAAVESVVTEALAELENTRLQAAITLQLVEVQQSRAHRGRCNWPSDTALSATCTMARAAAVARARA